MERIAALDDPRQRGKALSGNRAGFWRWRFGDYRVIAQLEDRKLVIVVVAVGHRREVYD
jgi:mRNA interferase RelE/StbE